MRHIQCSSAYLTYGEKMPLYRNFNLVLMVTADCNLGCRYCYIGKRAGRVMPLAFAQKAVERSLNSLDEGGKLELGFFGGEPLLEPWLVEATADYARRRSGETGRGLAMHLTTNGTLAGGAAWEVLQRDDIHIAVSCDGLADIHDRNRTTFGGRGTWQQVQETLRLLLAAGRDPWVVMVVGPDTVQQLAPSICFLADMGVSFIQPSLNLWSSWAPEALEHLERALAECADIWRQAEGRPGIGWFDEMGAAMAGIPGDTCARCAFGAGQIAVTPTGNLYPCERLVADDEADNPWRMPGHVANGQDFLAYRPCQARSHPSCDACTIRDICGTTCRCSNYVRTGDVARPDRLLCQLNQACFREVSRVLEASTAAGACDTRNRSTGQKGKPQ